MTETTRKNKETTLHRSRAEVGSVATQLSSFSVFFFKAVFKFLAKVCEFLKCVYQDYIFNRNYKRYLKYIDIYENIEEDDLGV